MADDRKKRHASHWDGEKRATWGRGKTEPGGGIPTEIDPEQTPPPREPPRPEVFDTLPPAAQLRALRDVSAEHTAALERVWDARHVSERLKRLETAVDQDTRQVTGLIVEVRQWADMSKKAFDKSTAISDKQIALDTRLVTFFDEQFPALLSEFRAFNGTLNSVSARVTDTETAIESMQQEQTEQAVALVDLKGRIKTIEDSAHEKQIAASAVVAERRRWFQVFKLGHAIAIAIGGGIVWFVHWLKS